MADAPSGPCRVEKILCPTDFAPGCAQILAMAAGIAEHFDARVRLLHVCKPDDDRPVDPVTVSPGRRDPLPPHPPPLPLIEDLRTLVNHLPETRRPRVVGEVVGGGVRDTILERAGDVEVVVMGTRGLTGLPHVLLGSVAETVVSRAPCPVLTVKPRAKAPFPRARVHTVRDGLRVLIRPVVAEDRDLMVRGIQQMSLESRYRRFLSPIRTLSAYQLRVLTTLDYRDHMAWGAVAADQPYEVPIGSSRYRRLEEEPEVAEAAVVVIDAYQRRGIGSLLLQALTRSAVANGIRAFRGFVLKDNWPVLHILENAQATMVDEGAYLRFDVPLPAPGEEREAGPLQVVFKGIARFLLPGVEAEELPDGFETVFDAYARLFR